MGARKRRAKRDIERWYSLKRFVAKLHRLANSIEQGQPFRIQIGGQRVSIPANAVISVEHERGKSEEEVEFQLRWPLP